MRAAELIAADKDCALLERDTDLAIDAAILPDDLVEFYQEAGGASLFPGSDFPVRMSAPGELVESNLEILGEQFPGDISRFWYVIGRGAGSERISIDLHPQRLGRCYDSFHEVHAVAGSCPVVATSFSELVERLVGRRGRHWYWLEPDWTSLGDAYGEPGQSATGFGRVRHLH